MSFDEDGSPIPFVLAVFEAGPRCFSYRFGERQCSAAISGTRSFASANDYLPLLSKTRTDSTYISEIDLSGKHIVYAAFSNLSNSYVYSKCYHKKPSHEWSSVDQLESYNVDRFHECTIPR